MKAIVTRYHGPTNFRGSRISATAEGVGRIYIPCPHDMSHDGQHRAAALKLCAKYKWNHADTLIEGGLPNGDCVFVFNPQEATQ